MTRAVETSSVLVWFKATYDDHGKQINFQRKIQNVEESFSFDLTYKIYMYSVADNIDHFSNSM